MATFTGTDLSDIIHPDLLSQGVISVPTGVRPSGAADRIFGRVGDDLLDGGGGSDEIHGDLGDDVLFGGSGVDLLFGGFGNDKIIGGAGADEMHGGDGIDEFYVDDTNDIVIDIADFRSPNLILASVNFTLPAGFFDLTLIETARNGIGSEEGNFIQGNQFANRLDGRNGQDILHGLGRNDILLGGDESDQLYGGSGRDTLRGEAGHDSIEGGRRADILIGGAGSDGFSYASAMESHPGSRNRDIVRAGDDAPAFEGAGDDPAGDHFFFSFDADRTRDDFQFFIFGGTGTGQLSVIDSGMESLVRGNIDADAAFEFKVLIEDGTVRASDYTPEDFLLSV